MKAIVYTTNTGSTEHYAKLLSQETGLPVYSLAEAKKDRTPAEDDMLDMMLHGGERVKAENLDAVLNWYHTQN